jgi:hypothetical protein
MEQRPGISTTIQESSEGPSIGFYAEYSEFKYALGYQIFCSKCNKPCYSAMSYYPCKDDFITDRIRCHLGCGRFWRLPIDCEVPVCH